MVHIYISGQTPPFTSKSSQKHIESAHPRRERFCSFFPLPSPPHPQEIKESSLEYGREYTQCILYMRFRNGYRSDRNIDSAIFNGACIPKFHSPRSPATIIGCAHRNAIRQIASFLNTRAHLCEHAEDRSYLLSYDGDKAQWYGLYLVFFEIWKHLVPGTTRSDSIVKRRQSC